MLQSSEVFGLEATLIELLASILIPGASYVWHISDMFIVCYHLDREEPSQ